MKSGGSQGSRGASEVIDETLLVGIVIVVTILIATVFIAYGEETFTPGPRASFEFEYAGESGAAGNLTVTHRAGQTIDAGELYLRGRKGDNANAGAACATADTGYFERVWYELDDTDSGGPFSRVSAGERGSVSCVGSDGTIRVVWDPENRNVSSTVALWEGPDS